METMPRYKDPSLPVEERVEDLLARMTLEEKAAQLCGDLPPAYIRDGQVDTEALRQRFPNGHGRFTQYSLTGLTDPAMTARISNQIQRYFVEETRLGIPVALQTENLCGWPGAGGTLFPAQINLASTWQPELTQEMSRVIGQESRAVGANSAMSPVIDVSRDPRWGRTYETYGEDPYLVSRMGVAYVKGMQADKADGVACIAKHFLGYAETQGGLNCAAARIGDRELYETFAAPFEAADKEAQVSAMMANYGEIDGIPVGANPRIARTLLRDTMGFDGVLTSDGAAIMKMWNFYHIADTYQQAGELALKGGLGTEIPVGASFAQLPQAVRAGRVDEALLDEAVRRVLAIKFRYGLFEHPYVDESAVAAAMTNPDKQALSRRIAERSLILLKNDGTLPLAAGKTVAVIGPHADNLRYPVSGYTYPAYIEMLEAALGGGAVSFQGIADEAAKAKQEKKPESPFASSMNMYPQGALAALGGMNQVLRNMGAVSLKEALESRFTVRYAPGCSLLGEDESGFADAVRAAAESDVAVLALGGNCGWVNVTGGEGKDRSRLDLPGVQQRLLEAVAATGKPVIVVLYGPGCFAVNWAAEHAAAILQAWMPGPAAGVAVAGVLAGTVNPGGKLPVSVPRSAGQIPVYYNHKVGSGYTDGADSSAAAIFSGGYVDGPADPLYPFGHGLSYTRFAVEDLSVPEQVSTDGTIPVTCTLRNTGDRAGGEVVQLYTHFNGAHVTRPNKQLQGFVRVDLAPGEQKRITFRLACAQLGYYNEAMRFGVEPGVLDVLVGTSSRELPLQAKVRLTGEAVETMGRRVYECPVTVE